MKESEGIQLPSCLKATKVRADFEKVTFTFFSTLFLGRSRAPVWGEVEVPSREDDGSCFQERQGKV